MVLQPSNKYIEELIELTHSYWEVLALLLTIEYITDAQNLQPIKEERVLGDTAKLFFPVCRKKLLVSVNRCVD